MPQNASPDVRSPAPATNDFPPELTVSTGQLKSIETLQERAMKLELQLADLGVQLSQLTEQRADATGATRDRLTKQITTVQHDLAAGSIELRSLREKVTQLQATMNAPVVAPATTTVQPPWEPSHSLSSEQIMQVVGGFGMLMIPLVLVFARNLWIRGSRKMRPVEVESSAGLERIEQAIEAIAVEVERIGEAQRFSTKLLSERQPDAIVNRAAASPVPRVITPH